MADKGFYIRRYRKNDGSYVAMDDKDLSLEEDFGFIRYKSMTGINSRGKQKGVYVETYAESNSARVWHADTVSREQITSTLSLLSFGADPSLPTELSVTEQILEAEKNWHSFYDKLEGCVFVWRDDYRQRKALFYVLDATEPKSDVIKGVPYIQCDVTLTNVFGQTFLSDSRVVEKWLASGGKEADV